MNLKESRQRLRAAELQYSQAEPGRNLTVAREELTEARLYYANACIALVERLPELLWPFASECSPFSSFIPRPPVHPVLYAPQVLQSASAAHARAGLGCRCGADLR